MSIAARCLLFFALFIAPSAAAQDSPPAAGAEKASPLTAILSKSSLTDEDRVALRTAIAEHVSEIVNGAVDASAKAVTEIRSEYSKGTPAAKEEYAKITIESVGGAYKSAKLERACQMIGVLTALNEAPAYRVFIEATSDARPAVRAAGAAGLRGLRQKLAQAGGDFFTASVEALKVAGKKETSTVGLRTIYQALNFPEVVAPPDAKVLTSAVIELLEARSEQYAGRSVKGEGADHLGMALASSLKASLSDGDRDKLILIAGRMMLHGVQRYISELIGVTDKSANAALIDARNQTEYLIDEAEKILLDILKPATPPALSKALRDPDKEADNPTAGTRVFEIKKAMNAWAEILRTKTGQKFELVEESSGG